MKLTFDRTSDGRSIKWLSILDEYTRECLALEARRGMTAEEVRAILAAVAAGRGGPPHRIRSDNGPEFAAEAIRSWLEGTGSGALYVAPSSPWQNGYAESFHSKLRDEFLDREEFENLLAGVPIADLRKETKVRPIPSPDPIVTPNPYPEPQPKPGLAFGGA